MNRTLDAMPSRTLLAVALCALGLLGHGGAAHAAVVPVTNCNASGPGGLAEAISAAASGDVIDMTALSCRRISLFLAPHGMFLTQNDLSIIGPGADRLHIDARWSSGIFRHTGTGTLRIEGVTLERGLFTSDLTTFDDSAFGGCIYSKGNVELRHARVRWCRVRALRDGRAFGAGIYAVGNVSLTGSEVKGNTAFDEGAFRQPEGGGVYTLGKLTAISSKICGNHAERAGGAHAEKGLVAKYTQMSRNDGGALEVTGPALILNTTIANNKNAWWTVTLDGVDGKAMVAIINSTVSGNRSRYNTVNMSRGQQSILNSTIAFNEHSGGCLNAAVMAFGETEVESTIAARNTCLGVPYDDIGGFSGDSIVGANNLIMSSSLPLPADTLTADPRLGPLADNGGPTPTHALLDTSPAIDAGNNIAGLTYDQRGPGHPRAAGHVDIGAIEH